MTKEELHDQLVHPVCALECCSANEDVNPIVETATRLLRRILDDLEADIMSDTTEEERKRKNIAPASAISLLHGYAKIPEDEYENGKKGYAIFGTYASPELIQSWDVVHLNDAVKELYRHHSRYESDGEFYTVEEWALRYEIYHFNSDDTAFYEPTYDYALERGYYISKTMLLADWEESFSALMCLSEKEQLYIGRLSNPVFPQLGFPPDVYVELYISQTNERTWFVKNRRIIPTRMYEIDLDSGKQVNPLVISRWPEILQELGRTQSRISRI
jgi:hypothetical protein